MNRYELAATPHITAGVGAREALGALAASTAGTKGKVLLVADPGLAATGMVEEVRAAIEKSLPVAAVFREFAGDPTIGQTDAAARLAREAQASAVVALGGGSALDAGKLIAFMVAQSRPIWDFEDIGDWWTRASTNGIAPIVAVPTTAGTGSEVGRAGVVTNAATHTKKIIFHPQMMPKVTICDPQLTVGMPAIITAGTGMDAFAHCLEAYCAPSYHPLGEGIAVEGTRLVRENLARAVTQDDDLVARSHMMSAALMGATAFQKGLGAIHALSHPVGALYDTHHGLTNAVFLPYVLVFNREAIEEKIKRLAAYLGLRSSFRAFLDFVLELRAEIGVPHTLAGLGVGDEKIDLIVAMAPDDPTAASNPVRLDRRAARTIFRRALEGRV